MMNDNDEDDDYSNDYSQDVPTDEEEEDRQYQEHSYNPTEFQEQPRVTPPSILLLPTIVTPTMIMVPTTHNTPPPRSPRTRRFTSLPLHLEESLARDSAATRSRSTTTSSTFPTFPSSDHPTHSPFSGGILESQVHAPRPHRAGCSRVLLVLVAYVGLMVFPRPPLLHMWVWSPHAGVVSTIPKLENEFVIIAPTNKEKVSATVTNEQMQNAASEQQQQSVAASVSQDAPQPKRRLRQPSLAHARTNRQRTVFYGGKPNASLLFLEHMEETPLQQRTLPRFFFSTSKNNGAANAAGRRSFFKKDSEHSDDQQQQQHQQQQHWLWWILYKMTWLILLGCTLEAGVREIPRRFHTWTGLWFHPSLHRINSSSAMNSASASSRHFDPSSSPPLLSRAFSTPRRRRG